MIDKQPISRAERGKLSQARDVGICWAILPLALLAAAVFAEV
ncbi:hypothetical protein [Lamprobacter modestohalophilus]|nr:hypothetical protein [Lamprobacter modestohalophilus]